MTSGCARICSPWKPNSSTSVASSATSESGASLREQPRRARPARRCEQHAAPDDLRDDHRDDDVEHHREQQRVPRHRDGGQAEQQPDDRREGDHHDRVVQRDLAQREMRLALASGCYQTNTMAVQGAAARMIRPAM